jgi:hypothetical protein
VLGLGGDLSLTVAVVLLVIAALVFEAVAADVSLGAGADGAAGSRLWERGLRQGADLRWIGPFPRGSD